MKPEKDWPQEFNAIECGIAVMTVLEPKVEEDGIKLCRRLFPLENFSTLSRLVRRTAAVHACCCRDEISTPWKCAPDNHKKIINSFIVNPGEYDAALKISMNVPGPIYVQKPRFLWTNYSDRWTMTGKRWGAIFTCLVTRGIHLEVTHGLSTDEALKAFSRFIDIRGLPFAIYSDNETNFVGASRR
ncbi:hypothetical protein LAZ67_11001925 [Cordylochernes scorpioides]|uniref:Integrase catalytic domain-containing protein n=1 Tax=Cordylochernes scorpioides TaxID=51811 RepID=A0ABY6L3N5_9ARAC|nr:hypothetical protein LAZ67_11001925 [Cordylochernes scorpioides]